MKGRIAVTGLCMALAVLFTRALPKLLSPLNDIVARTTAPP